MSLKESLPGFFIEKDPAELTNVVVSMDTNILFSLLTVNQKTFNQLYTILEKLSKSNQLFVSNHVAEEYLLGANKTCREDGKIYSELDKKIEKKFSDFKSLQNDYKGKVKDYDVIEKKIQELCTDFKDFFNKQIIKVDYEKRSKQIETLFTNVGKAYSRKKLYKIQKEIAFRYSAFIAPGFEDRTKENGNRFGDCLIWFQLMDYAKDKQKDIIYITLEEKPDWKFDKNFKKELFNEFYNETEQKLFIYNPDDFVSIYNKLTKTKEPAEKATETETSRKLTELLIDSLPKTSWNTFELPLVTTSLDSNKWSLLDANLKLDDAGLLSYNTDHIYGNLLTQNYNLYNTAELIGKKTQLSILDDAVNSRFYTLSIMNNMIDQKNKQFETKTISETSSQKEEGITDSLKKEETDKKENK